MTLKKRSPLDMTACAVLATALTAFLLHPVTPVAGTTQDVDRVFVINSLAETMGLVDRAGDSVVKNLLPLGLAPNRIRYGGSVLLVVNSTSDDLWVIDASTFAVLRKVTFADGTNPWDVAYINDTLCAVSMLLSDNIELVNQASGARLRQIAAGKSPEGLLVVGNTLWVANTGFDFGTYTYGQGTVSVVNLTSGASLASVPVGTNPQALATAPDGTIHVVCTGNYGDRTGMVYVLSEVERSVIDTLAVGGYPGEIAIGADGSGYLAAGGFADSGEVYRYDAAARTLLNGPANPWRTARGVMSVTPRLEGGVFAFCFSADTLVELSPGGAVVRAYEVGDGPACGAYLTNRLPGDVNEDRVLDILDVVDLVNIAFRNGARPQRPGSADVNADCVYDVLDVVSLVNVVFRGGHGLRWGCVK